MFMWFMLSLPTDCCLSGMESWNFAVFADTNRAYICCDVCSLLGPVSLILFLGQNSKGWLQILWWFFFFVFCIWGSQIFWIQFLLTWYFFWFVKVWVATESGNLEVTYTHNEEHVCIQIYSCSPGYLKSQMTFRVLFEM